VIFIRFRGPQALKDKLEADWAASCAEVILGRCPACERDSIIGHGRRRKQVHDEHHDRIGIRCGRCPGIDLPRSAPEAELLPPEEKNPTGREYSFSAIPFLKV